jgi:hypothetical protein
MAGGDAAALEKAQRMVETCQSLVAIDKIAASEFPKWFAVSRPLPAG